MSFAFKLSPRSFQPRCWNSLKNDPLSPFHAKAMSLEVCRYNTMHYVAKEEMQKHYLECESANRAIQDSKPVVSLVLKLKTIFFSRLIQETTCKPTNLFAERSSRKNSF